MGHHHDCFSSHFRERDMAGRSPHRHARAASGEAESTASKSAFTSFHSLSIMSLGGERAYDSRRACAVDAADTPSAYPVSQRRFIAGERFYNHEMLGSLRKGGAVSLWSCDGLGLAAATFSSVLSFAVLQDSLSPLHKLLGLGAQQDEALQRLATLPMTTCVLFGLLSDAQPVCGTRRKSYAVLGVLLSGASILGLASLSAVLESREEAGAGLTAACVLCVATASTGCAVTQLMTHTRTIELSQQETLCRRGVFQACYLAVCRLSRVASAALSFCTVADARVPHSTSMLALVAVATLLPLPLVVRCWSEGLVLRAHALATLRMHGALFWRAMQQKAVWRIVAFIFCFSLLLGVHFRDSELIVESWARGGDWRQAADAPPSRGDALVTRCVHEGAVLTAILTWRLAFVNRPWRRFFLVAPLLHTAPRALASALISSDAARSMALYRAAEALAATGDGVAAFASLVPLTEITLEGCEAATVGLVLTLQHLSHGLLATAGSALRGDAFYRPQDVLQDSATGRWGVLGSLLVSYGVNLLALLPLALLPLQKLDAQQQRTYGGFSTRASASIAATSAALLGFCVLANALAFAPSASCLRVAGGHGC